MNFDFNLILLPLTLIFGLGYILDRLKFKQRKTQGAGKESSLWIRWSNEFFPIVAILFVVRAFIVEPFNIPSSSMVPTLYTGDFIAVTKYSYGIRLPILHTKILNTGEPKAGDVVVFRYPKNPKIYYIKRVIGQPNDTIRFQNGVLSVNGKTIDTKPTDFIAQNELTEQLYPAGSQINGMNLTADQASQLGKDEEEHAQYFQETQGEHTHLVRYLQSNEDIAWEVTVPAGQYFVMGDNRDRSEDSRYWGFVPEENLVGQATYVWMHKPAGLHLPTFRHNGKIN